MWLKQTQNGQALLQHSKPPSRSDGHQASPFPLPPWNLCKSFFSVWVSRTSNEQELLQATCFLYYRIVHKHCRKFGTYRKWSLLHKPGDLFKCLLAMLLSGMFLHRYFSNTWASEHCSSVDTHCNVSVACVSRVISTPKQLSKSPGRWWDSHASSQPGSGTVGLRWKMQSLHCRWIWGHNSGQRIQRTKAVSLTTRNDWIPPSEEKVELELFQFCCYKWLCKKVY